MGARAGADGLGLEEKEKMGGVGKRKRSLIMKDLAGYVKELGF